MANRNAEVNDPKRLEAEARAIMWEHSRIDPNQWGSRSKNAAARARLRAEFDEIVDRRALSLMLLELEAL